MTTEEALDEARRIREASKQIMEVTKLRDVRVIQLQENCPHPFTHRLVNKRLYERESRFGYFGTMEETQDVSCRICKKLLSEGPR